MSTSARLLALLALLQAPRVWPGSVLAERLEVSRRTIRRDIERLRDLGYPVAGTMGADGGYRLVAGSAIPPLLLDDDEAVSIVVGLRTVAGNALAGIDEASVRALAKLEQVLPARLRARFRSLAAATTWMTWYEATTDPEVLTAVARAIGADELLRFVYRAADGSESRRSVEPKGLVVFGRRWYVVGWDEDRADWRIFRADRMQDPWSSARRAPRHDLPDGQDAASFIRARQLARAQVYRLVATIHAPAELVAPRARDVATELDPLGPDRCRLTIDGDTLEWLLLRLIVLGADFEIEEPLELVDHTRSVLDRLNRALGVQA